MPEWRKATWALALWNVAMILWAATAMDGIGNATCAGESGAARTVCEVGLNLGLTYGLSLVVVVWSIGVAALGLVWLMSRPRTVAN